MKAMQKRLIGLWTGLLVSFLYMAAGTTVMAAYPAINGDNSLEWITNVTFSTINHDSAADSGGYGDNSAMSTTVAPGSTYNLSVTIKPDVGEKISAFIDWNHDEDFADPGEEVVVTPDQIQSPDPDTFTVEPPVAITVPWTAALASTRMRVVLSYLNNSGDPVQSSGTLPGGEAEDYTLVIANPGGGGPLINASAGAGGAISPSGSVNVTSGTDQAFTITPNPGFFIDDVVVDGVSQGAVPTYTFTGVVVNHTIVATFSATLTHTITASAGANGAITPVGSVKVNDGASQEFSILAAPGFKVADVVVDGGSVGAVSSYTFTNVTGGHTIAATFTADATYPPISSTDFSHEWITNVTFGTINNSSNAEGYGSFLDQSAAVQRGGAYPISISIQPQANENISVFIDWNHNGVFTDAGEETKVAVSIFTAGPHLSTITVPAGATLGTTRMRVVVRYFEPAVSSGDLGADNAGGEAEDYTLVVGAPVPAISATAGANGTITPSGMIPLSSGASQGFTITPDTGYLIKDVRVDGVSLGKPFPATYTFTGVTVTHTIHADFSLVPVYTITASAGPHGTLTPSGAVEVAEGGSQVFMIAPETGYMVQDVLVDGGSVGPLLSYTFSSVNADHTISALFATTVPPTKPFHWSMFLPAIINNKAP